MFWVLIADGLFAPIGHSIGKMMALINRWLDDVTHCPLPVAKFKFKFINADSAGNWPR